MSKKQWYEIEIECIKSGPCILGEKWIAAKVKSYGLAFSVAEHLISVYKPEYFKVTIK